ncbi:FaeA/PapI family transcriptional regulator [Yokenella regensburgei]|uniref:FaeA/PapI family transcriptional regulator n=1 Tax=Yokenella regensburgei TaxID=158877 RepID=UPI003EDA8DF1
MMMEILYATCPEGLSSPPDPALWPKTRQLADACDEDIYTARLLLLSLETDGKVICSHCSIGNSLRWFLAGKTTEE